MKYKILVTALVLFVLALVMLAPVAAQNTCTTSGFANETHASGYNTSAWQVETWWLGGSPVGGSTTTHNEAGSSSGWSSAVYGSVSTCNMGGGTGTASQSVIGQNTGSSSSTTTVSTYSGDASNGYTSDSQINTNEAWFNDFNSGETTTWTP